ncbi:MAG: 2-amino-4-hydroxy-6-hydroxymethyldihydropteridine diphosphokinase [Rhodospirillales bacterium]|nr:2-amino-4-hydroxy-6-hydroxymethyldihydropteridine diphosphokinase [Rhodospirillales bacterium]
MIIIGIGANLPHPEFGSPRATCETALLELAQTGLNISGRSFWYESAPVLAAHGAQGEQPWYVNAAISVETELSASDLLARLLSVEARFGRIRSIANAPRTLDLDIVAYHDQIINADHLEIPHPRMNQRAFVLLPLADIAPDWIHPANGQTVASMIENLPIEQDIRRMDE